MQGYFIPYNVICHYKLRFCFIISSKINLNSRDDIILYNDKLDVPCYSDYCRESTVPLIAYNSLCHCNVENCHYYCQTGKPENVFDCAVLESCRSTCSLFIHLHLSTGVTNIVFKEGTLKGVCEVPLQWCKSAYCPTHILYLSGLQFLFYKSQRYSY